MAYVGDWTQSPYFKTAYDALMGQPSTSPPGPSPSKMAPQPNEQDDLDRIIMAALMPQQATTGLAPKPNWAQKLGPLDVPWSNTPRPSAASYLLRGLVSGFNGKVGRNPLAVGGGRAGAAPNPLEMGRYALAIKTARDLAANRATDNARAQASVTQSEADRAAARADREQFHRDTLAAQDRADARANKYLGIAFANLGLRKNADARAAQRAARQQQIAAAYAKWPPMMQHDYESRLRMIFNAATDPDQRDAEVDALNEEFGRKSALLGNPFRDPYQQNAEMNVVTGGHSSTAPGGTPDNPLGLSRKKK